MGSLSNDSCKFPTCMLKSSIFLLIPQNEPQPIFSEENFRTKKFPTGKNLGRGRGGISTS